MPYRVAADVLQHLLPIDAGKSPETLRSHTLRVGKQLGDASAEKPLAAAAAIRLSLDSTFIRNRDGGERHLEVRVGNVETVDGSRQVFGAVARAETDVTALSSEPSMTQRKCWSPPSQTATCFRSCTWPDWRASWGCKLCNRAHG
jgi:hypothetical protein